MTGKYAAGTDVSPEKSRMEIERTLVRYGATGFFFGSEGPRSMIGFRAHERIVRFTIATPPLKDFGEHRDPGRAQAAEIRRRWRCLLIAIKAKLEVVASGIAEFEEEFLSYIVTPDGPTVGQMILPAIAKAYETGKPVPLLLGTAP